MKIADQQRNEEDEDERNAVEWGVVADMVLPMLRVMMHDGSLGCAGVRVLSEYQVVGSGVGWSSPM